MIDYYILFVAILTLVLTFFIWRFERLKELSRLISLFDHLIFIKKSAEGHEKQLKSDAPIPSWPVANMDLNFYLTQINFRVRRKYSLCFEDTRKLKKELIGIFEKINNINYLWEQEVKDPKIITDLKSSTYYFDLNYKIENALHEIRRIIK